MKAETVDEFYNVGTGRRTSLKELAVILLALTNSDQTVTYAPQSSATLVRNRIGDLRKASDQISFEASISLRDGLEQLIEWRDNHKAEVQARRMAVGIGQ